MDVEYFDNLDDFLAVQQQREQEANERVTAEQASISWGDYFENLNGMQKYGFPIYGHVFTVEEFCRMEHESGAEDEELVFELEILKQTHARGYRHGRCYSREEPDGEIGDTHISIMRKISPEEFEAARGRGWR